MTRENIVKSSQQHTMIFSPFSKPLPTVIQQVTTPGGKCYGKFFIVGSVPMECTEVRQAGKGLPHRASKIYSTLADACAAVEASGVSRYQLPDCSWNKPL